jgi:hypothetical protein
MKEGTVISLRRDVAALPGAPQTRAIAPHRSYRTARMPISGVIASVLMVAAIEACFVFSWQRLAAFVVNIDTAIVNRVVSGASIVPHAFLGHEIGATSFVMREHSVPELALWIVVCALVVAAVTLRRGLSKPLQYFINVNAIVIALEAAFLLAFGKLGYSAGTFSQLLLHTMIVTWFVMPFFIGVVALLFPFKAWESAGLILAVSAYVVLLEAVRYAVFCALLTRTGPILMSDLYLLYGPLLDILPVVGIFGIVLTRLSSRLQRTPEAWRWL